MAKPPEVETGDLERPLDASTLNDLETRWAEPAARPKFIHQLRPAPPFRNRIFREIRTATNKLVHVEKVRSMDEHRVQPDPVEVSIGGTQVDGTRLLLETSRRATRQIKTCLEYYSSLRLLMGTYAYCGSHMVPASGEALLREAPRFVQFFTWSAP